MTGRTEQWFSGWAAPLSFRRYPAFNGTFRVLLPDLFAYAIFLLIQHALFRLADMPAVLVSHEPLFLADMAVFPMQLCRLGVGHITFAHLLLNPVILVREALIHLFTARVRRFPRGIGRGCAGIREAQGGHGYNGSELASERVHVFLRFDSIQLRLRLFSKSGFAPFISLTQPDSLSMTGGFVSSETEYFKRPQRILYSPR
jgi:hypothetical protein